MPAEPPLTEAEAVVLNVLMEHDRRPADRTIDAISDASQFGASETGQALRALERRRPALVRREVDEGLGVQFWQTTHDAADAVE